jgi:hypothetical protein
VRLSIPVNSPKTAGGRAPRGCLTHVLSGSAGDASCRGSVFTQEIGLGSRLAELSTQTIAVRPGCELDCAQLGKLLPRRALERARPPPGKNVRIRACAWGFRVNLTAEPGDTKSPQGRNASRAWPIAAAPISNSLAPQSPIPILASAARQPLRHPSTATCLVTR